MKRPYPLITLALCLPLAACINPGWTDSDSVRRGHAVAQQWCSGCHQVAREQQPPALAAGRPAWSRAPSFMEIAEYPNVDHSYLRGLASEFYFPMPEFHLKEADQEDVIMYILSLKGQI
jgi:mono/diheme cytochrome c family protein